MTEKKAVTRIQKAVQLEQVPQERMAGIVKSTLIGTMLNGIGLYGLYVALQAFQETKELNTSIVVGAACFILLGSTVWSKQLIVGSLMALRAPFKAYRALAGKDDA